MRNKRQCAGNAVVVAFLLLLGGCTTSTSKSSVQEDHRPTSVVEVVAALQADADNASVHNAIAILKAAVNDRHAYPCGDVGLLIETVGDLRIVAADEVLVEFLKLDSSGHDESILMRRAVRAIAKINSPNALESISTIMNDHSDDIQGSVAVALGLLKDDRAVPLLHELADRPSAHVKSFALSSLAGYCDERSVNVVYRGLACEDEEVRRAAMHWLAMCANRDHIPEILRRLSDPDGMVQANALRGLLRLGVEDGCEQCARLLQDEDQTVRVLAEEYCSSCE